MVELYGEEKRDSDPHETIPHPHPYRPRQVSVALAALALGAEEPLSTSLSSQARRLGGRGARATLGCVGGALTRLADAIPSSRSFIGGSTGVPVFDAPATISTSRDDSTETLPTEVLPEKQEQSAVVAGQPGERLAGPAVAAASRSASSSDVRLRTAGAEVGLDDNTVDPPPSTAEEGDARSKDNYGGGRIPGEDAGPEAGSSSLTIQQRTNQLEIAADFDVDGDGDIGFYLWEDAGPEAGSSSLTI